MYLNWKSFKQVCGALISPFSLLLYDFKTEFNIKQLFSVLVQFYASSASLWMNCSLTIKIHYKYLPLIYLHKQKHHFR